jgi:hypothetical protein
MSTHIIEQLRSHLAEIDRNERRRPSRPSFGKDTTTRRPGQKRRWGTTARFVLVAASVAPLVGGTLVARERMPRSDVRPAGPVSTATATEDPVIDPAVLAEYEAAESATGMNFPDDVELPSPADQLGRLPTSAGDAPDFEDALGAERTVAPTNHVWASRACFAVIGAATLTALVTDLDRMAALAIIGAVLVAVDVGIWLRNNPTLKQQQRRAHRGRQ